MSMSSAKCIPFQGVDNRYLLVQLEKTVQLRNKLAHGQFWTSMAESREHNYVHRGEGVILWMIIVDNSIVRLPDYGHLCMRHMVWHDHQNMVCLRQWLCHAHFADAERPCFLRPPEFEQNCGGKHSFSLFYFLQVL